MARVDDLCIEAHDERTSGRRWLLIAAAGVVVLIIAAFGWRHMNRGQDAAPDVEILRVRQANTNPSGSFAAGGYVEVVPPGPVVVSTMIEGRLSSVSLVEGDSVAQGQEVARIDDAIHRNSVSIHEASVALSRAKLERLEAGFRLEEIEQARAALEGVQAELRVAESELARAEELLAIGASPARLRDEARGRVESLRAGLLTAQSELELRERGYRQEDIAIARAELAAAEAELARAEWHVAACSITAPVSGIVFEGFAQPGQWLSPSDGGGAAVLSIIDPTRLQVWVDVNQRDSARLRVGQAVSLQSDAAPDERLSGRVARILPKANLQKNTVQAKISLEGQFGGLRPGMSVQVTFLSESDSPVHSGAVRIPESAIVQLDDSSTAVFVVEHGVAQQRLVVVGERVGEQVAIVDGLRGGEFIVATAQQVSEGQRVEPLR